MRTDLTRLAQQMIDDGCGHTQIHPPSARGYSLTEAEAYRLQTLLLDSSKSTSVVQGYKMAGLSAFGEIRPPQVFHGGDGIPWSGLFTPRIEVELAVVIGAPRNGAHADVEGIPTVIERIVPAFEIVDTRYIEGISSTNTDWIADNCNFGCIVLGQLSITLDEIDSLSVGVSKNGEPTTVRHRPDLPDPRAVVLAAERLLRKYDRSLSPGDVVLTGSRIDPLGVDPGDHIEANFDGLGRVSVRFAA